jgi:hypothetical protein
MNYHKPAENFLFVLLFVQGLYYFVTGVWPILHIQSFVLVTGPKTDIWLVKTFGMLISICGISMLLTALNRKYNLPIFTLAIMAIIGFIIFEVYYVWTKTISVIYLADAGFQFLLLLLWFITFINLNKPRKIRY